MSCSACSTSCRPTRRRGGRRRPAPTRNDSAGGVADDFDVVVLAVLDEGGVVVLPLIGTRAGLAVVAPAGGQRRGVERVHRLAGRHAKRIVTASRGPSVPREPED